VMCSGRIDVALAGSAPQASTRSGGRRESLSRERYERFMEFTAARTGLLSEPSRRGPAMVLRGGRSNDPCPPRWGVGGDRDLGPTHRRPTARADGDRAASVCTSPGRLVGGTLGARERFMPTAVWHEVARTSSAHGTRRWSQNRAAERGFVRNARPRLPKPPQHRSVERVPRTRSAACRSSRLHPT